MGGYFGQVDPLHRYVLFLLFIFALIVCTPVMVKGQNLRVKVAPEVLVPLDSADPFGLGGGGSLVVDREVLGFLAPYLGVDVRFIAPDSPESNILTLSSGSAGLGVFAFPLPRLKIGMSAGSGIYIGSYTRAGEDAPTRTGNLLWRLGAEIGYRFSPGFTISGSVGYTDYMQQVGSFYKGLSISLTADFGVNSNKAAGRVILEEIEANPIFPVTAHDYRTDSFGTVLIRNAESAEIRNVEVWFSADGYTSSPALCAGIPYMRRGASTEVPLLAFFSDQIMQITENVRISGEVVITYELLGEPRSSTAETTIAIMHRNALTWNDPRLLASFVSPNDPAVLDSSKFYAGVVRSDARSELDANLQYALSLFEGFRLSDIAWQPDPQTPYAVTRTSSSNAVAYTQYPHQTIAYRSGDSDDIAALYASALESIGIPAALIPLADEVLVAFMLSSSEQNARQMFLDQEAFLYIEGGVWVPVRVSMLREGFLRAWSEGAKMAAAAHADKDILNTFFLVTDAWQRYPPAAVPNITIDARKPHENQIRRAFNNVISLIITREVSPRAERMQASFAPGGGTGRQRNALGILYARYGMYEEALTEFQAAAERGEQRAGINIGNVAFLMEDFETAVEWYEQAMKDMVDQVAPIIGLSRSLYELDMYEKADDLFNRAISLRPELAQRYSYLSAQLIGTTATVRASAVMDRIGDMMWEE